MRSIPSQHLFSIIDLAKWAPRTTKYDFVVREVHELVQVDRNFGGYQNLRFFRKMSISAAAELCSGRRTGEPQTSADLSEPATRQRGGEATGAGFTYDGHRLPPLNYSEHFAIWVKQWNEKL
jgi:hypothetical protein